MKFSAFIIGSGLLLVLTPASFAAERASMEAPVIRASEDSITVSARFSNLSTDGVYRIAAGVASGDLESAQLELKKEGDVLDLEVIEYTQGYTSSWWDVSEIAARGYQLEGAGIPDDGSSLYLKVTLPLGDADRTGKFYIFVAKQYGPTTWYLEDGSEISDW